MVLPYIIAAGVGLYGAKKQSDAAKSAQNTRNEATQALSLIHI